MKRGLANATISLNAAYCDKQRKIICLVCRIRGGMVFKDAKLQPDKRWCHEMQFLGCRYFSWFLIFKFMIGESYRCAQRLVMAQTAPLVV